MKKTINYNLSPELLKDYTEFEKINSNWNIQSYLNYNYDLNDVLAFSKLFFPDFIEDKGCIILEILYNSDNLNEWYSEFNGNVVEVEKMCNLYELKDFFHIKTEYDNGSVEIKEFGVLMKFILELNLYRLFPEKKFIVNIFEEYESHYITFFQVKK